MEEEIWINGGKRLVITGEPATHPVGIAQQYFIKVDLLAAGWLPLKRIVRNNSFDMKLIPKP